MNSYDREPVLAGCSPPVPSLHQPAEPVPLAGTGGSSAGSGRWQCAVVIEFGVPIPRLVPPVDLAGALASWSPVPAWRTVAHGRRSEPSMRHRTLRSSIEARGWTRGRTPRLAILRRARARRPANVSFQHATAGLLARGVVPRMVLGARSLPVRVEGPPTMGGQGRGRGRRHTSHRVRRSQGRATPANSQGPRTFRRHRELATRAAAPSRRPIARGWAPAAGTSTDDQPISRWGRGRCPSAESRVTRPPRLTARSSVP